MFLAAVYKSSQKLWSDTYITELLRFRNKYILAVDLNAKRPAWNSEVSNSRGLKFLELFVSSYFEILAPQSSRHCTPDGRGDVLDIAEYQNIRLSEVTATDTLDSNHLPIIFSILNTVKPRKAFGHVEELTDWELFKASPLN
jgi:hypothetical protein